MIMNSGFKVIAGFLGGAAIGSILGILLAPASGKKTRRLLVQEAKDFEEDIERAAQRGLRHAKEIIADSVDDVVEVGKEKFNSLKNRVKA